MPMGVKDAWTFDDVDGVPQERLAGVGILCRPLRARSRFCRAILVAIALPADRCRRGQEPPLKALTPWRRVTVSGP